MQGWCVADVKRFSMFFEFRAAHPLGVATPFESRVVAHKKRKREGGGE